ncbi:hypothetical protein [Streptomyces violaceusniger]|uniref:Uncharacterized protein n=1 Tax=Streptomyces violaceusniger (strain Tu 4113) TaxID=653045 RepID=G2PFD1_STRV4|nr:hypothetical protein [Streptomyces violaceusniger]AEM84196.1 hypothetical protein Strvi_4599 [Streptomyces violaceusniger Tu 4113]AEM84274.1 hypothetical protein Strvi_4695 [Streptomyces violaceusniger Tu 4113]
MPESQQSAREPESESADQAERRKNRRHELWLKVLDVAGKVAGKALDQR